MLSHLLTQLLRSFGIFFRTIRAFFTRKLVGIWARLKRMTNLSRQATKVASDSLQSAAALTKKPEGRGDYVETRRLFVSKRFLLVLAAGLAAAAAFVYFVAWPFVLSNFLTAHFYVEDSRVRTWTGRAVVYADAEKTVPLYEGRLEDGLLQGRGKEYDAEGLLTYEGMFADGVHEGRGTAYARGVITYAGDFAGGVCEGTGKQFTDGALSYEGSFSDGLPNGTGTAYDAAQNVIYEGTFVDGLYEGAGTAFNETGARIYQGGFAQGVYSGTGSLFPAEGQRIDATFVGGQPDGAIAWYKNGKLYYDGAADGLTPSGYGTLYSPNGKAAYQGQMKDGTIDGAWLVNQTAADFRAALGEQKTTDHNKVLGGFLIAAPELGLSALCSYQTADQEPLVRAVYLAQPEQDCFALLPGQDRVSLVSWGTPQTRTRSFTAIAGVRAAAGDYTSDVYALDGCQAEVLRLGETAALLSWVRPADGAAPAGGTTDGGAAAQGEAATQAGADEERLETFLASLDLMSSPQAADAPSRNPYYGTADAAQAVAGCATAEQAEQTLDALCDYWVQAETRLALEGSRARTEELLADAQTALAGGTGDQKTVDALHNQVNALTGQINVCVTEMAKAAMQADAAGGADPKEYALDGLAVSFDPTNLPVDELALVATAYAQATAGADAEIDSAAITLTLKTALADLTTAYSGIQAALAAHQTAVDQASDAAGQYAMGTGSKAAWYAALSSQAESGAALYAAIGGFVRQLNAVNCQTGGWISRTQGWMTDALLPLYMAASTEGGKPLG